MNVDVIQIVTNVAPGLGTLALPITLGLVNVWGKLGLTGRLQLVSSLLTGLVIGGGYSYLVIQPADAVHYSAVVALGLITGLTASGVYDVGKDLLTKVMVKSS